MIDHIHIRVASNTKVPLMGGYESNCNKLESLGFKSQLETLVL